MSGKKQSLAEQRFRGAGGGAMRVCRLGASQLTCLASQLETAQQTKGLAGLGLPTTNRNTSMVRNSARTQRLLSRVPLGQSCCPNHTATSAPLQLTGIGSWPVLHTGPVLPLSWRIHCYQTWRPLRVPDRLLG